VAAAAWRRRRGGAAAAARASWSSRKLVQTVRPGTPPASAVRRQSPRGSEPAQHRRSSAIASRSSVASAGSPFSFTSRLERRMRSAATPSGLRFAACPAGSAPLPPPLLAAAGDAGHRWRWASPSEGFLAIFAGTKERKGRSSAVDDRKLSPPSCATGGCPRAGAQALSARRRARVRARGSGGGGGGRAGGRRRRRRRRSTCHLRSTGSAPAPLLTATTFAGNQVSSNSSRSPSTRSVPEYCARTGIPGCSSESSGWR
jgi:hypothetical protein